MKERLIEFLAYLGIGQTKFEEKAGLSRGFVNTLKNNITIKTLSKIKLAYPELNIEWLLNEKGEMLNQVNANTKDVYIEEIDTEEKYTKAIETGLKMIPETDFIFNAGQTKLVGTNQPVRYWYLPDCEDCEAIATMAGNSMLPTYPPGCNLAFKRYGYDSNNPNTIAFGNVFGIVTEDKQTGEWIGYVKILRRHNDSELAKRYWIARSINPEFDDFDIELQQVRALWILKQHIVTDS